MRYGGLGLWRLLVILFVGTDEELPFVLRTPERGGAGSSAGAGVVEDNGAGVFARGLLGEDGFCELGERQASV